MDDLIVKRLNLKAGALEGLMLETLAKASGIAPERLRRAAMMAGDIARVAQCKNVICKVSGIVASAEGFSKIICNSTTDIIREIT